MQFQPRTLLASISLLALAAVCMPAWSADYSLAGAAPIGPRSTGWQASSGLHASEASIGFALRHELRLRTLGAGLPALESAQATYRYTLVDQTHWAWKLGFKTSLDSFSNPLRSGLNTDSEAHKPHLHPMLHMSGEARFSDQWRFSMDANGLLTAQGYALDLGVRVGYRISPGFSLYGGLKLSNHDGIAETPRFNTENSADVGIELRF